MPRQDSHGWFYFYETILVFVNGRDNNFLNHVCQELGEKFKSKTDKRDKSIVTNCHGSRFFLYQGNVCSVNALYINITLMKIMPSSVELFFN
jgi:hypothetical protein